MHHGAGESESEMSSDDLRGKLLAALQDPRRRQLAHIAILDLAMETGQALEAGGLARAAVEEATEALSAYLTGERDDVPTTPGEGPAVSDIVATALTKLSQNPAFASLFR